MKLVIIDNYDSFTYNLSHLVKELGAEVDVFRNDKFSLDTLKAYDKIILSPGPGRPSEAGIIEDVIREFIGEIPILGVCLGHQAICEVYGATVSYASRLMHGKKSLCKIDDTSKIFKGIKEETEVARYHSLSAKKETIPEELKITAVSLDDGEVMAVEDRDNKVYGLQFHPESILTPDGKKMLENFFKED